jgi:hypothetical protein
MKARLAAVAFLYATAAGAADLEIPAKYAAAIDRANELGASIYQHDMAAWRATDVLTEHKALGPDTRVRGWLTDEYVSGKGTGVLVTFIANDREKPEAIYRVRVPPDGPPGYEALTPPAPLDDAQLARWRARNAAMDAMVARTDLCKESYNTVVLPAGTAGFKGIPVYLLAATAEPDVVVAGGHFLYEYSRDGSRLLSQRSFTRSCIDIPSGGDPSKGKPVALTLTHLMDETPTEVHAWLSRNYGRNIYLGTTSNSLMWAIVDGRIVGAISIDEKAKSR